MRPRGACGRHGVPDHRFDRAQRGARSAPVRAPEARASVVSSRHPPRGVPVPCASRRPTEEDRCRPSRHARSSASTCPSTAGLMESRAAPVARRAGAANDSVNAVSVLTASSRRFKTTSPDPFTNQEPIGAAIERPDPTAPAECAELGRRRPESLVVTEVHPSGEDEIPRPLESSRMPGPPPRGRSRTRRQR